MTAHDTIVIGAGATGLTAAWRLVEAGQDVLVLEARDRVGGRLRTERHGDSDFEIGGQWISPDQTALSSIVNELGLKTYARYRDGDMLYVNAEGDTLRFSGDVMPVSDTTNAAIDALTDTLDDLAAKMDPDRPWEHPDAAALDKVTFAQWLEQQTDDAEARDNVGLYIGPAMLTKPAYAFSALQAVQMAASAGSFSNLLDADFILDRRVVGGLASVPRELAERLGDRIRLDADVERIDRFEDHAVVHVNGEAHEARHVILALPPTHVGRIRIQPQLPTDHRHARQHQSFGLVIKVQPEYATPFWRDSGLSGTGFAPYELVHEVYDNTIEGATTGTLVAFVSDVNADTLGRLSEGERRAAVLASIAKYFGPEAEQPITYVESDWQHQELTGGAYATSFAMGFLTRYGRYLREPVGALLFGSSDVAGHGYQHVDGAIRVGTQLAEQILEFPQGANA